MPRHAATNSSVHARNVSPYSLQEKLTRVAWWFVQATLFRWSWHNMYRWRNWLLRLFGAKIAPTARIRPTVRIECPWNLLLGQHSVVGDFVELYALGMITIGDHAMISQYSYLCAGSHDYDLPDLPLERTPVNIGDNVWVAAGAFVGPGVSIAEGAILGARGCAMKDLQAWTIYGGNPAVKLKERPRQSRE